MQGGILESRQWAGGRGRPHTPHTNWASSDKLAGCRYHPVSAWVSCGGLPGTQGSPLLPRKQPERPASFPGDIPPPRSPLLPPQPSLPHPPLPRDQDLPPPPLPGPVGSIVTPSPGRALGPPYRSHGGPCAHASRAGAPHWHRPQGRAPSRPSAIAPPLTVLFIPEALPLNAGHAPLPEGPAPPSEGPAPPPEGPARF